MINENKRIQSVERAMRVLELLALNGGEMSLQALSEHLQLHKSTVHGLLNTLAAMGYVARNGSCYVLGLRLLDLSRPLEEAEEPLRALFAPALHRLYELSAANCYLAVPCGSREYRYLEVMRADGRRIQPSPRSRREGLTTSAIGQVLLAFDEELVRVLRRSEALDGELEQTLRQVRARGFALDLEIAQPGLHCMALPLWCQGRAVAALAVSGETEQLSERRLQHLARSMQRFLLDNIQH